MSGFTQHPHFRVHRLNPDGLKKAGAIQVAFDRLVDDLSDFCPDGREKSILMTKLEEACFFAKKAMASASSNQQAHDPSVQIPGVNT